MQTLVQISAALPTVQLFLDKRRVKANNTFPVKLTVYYLNKKKRYATGIDLTLIEWNRLKGERLRDENLKGILKSLQEQQGKMLDCIKTLQPFSFNALEKVLNPIAESDDEIVHNSLLESWFSGYINVLEEEERLGTASTYRTTMNSLTSYKGNSKITDVDKTWVKGYIKHLSAQHKSEATIGIYLRNLRAIINRAISKGVIKQEDYPFKGLLIPTGQNIKKALNDQDIKKLINYKPDCLKQQKALNYWLLSYYCNGMNFTDIALLRKGDYDGNFIYFQRAKTKRTKKKSKLPITVGLNSNAKAIIENIRNNDMDNPFLFPILKDDLSPTTIRNRCHKFIKTTNQEMQIIRQDLKIQRDLKTYAARHSFSTVLKRNGAPISFIQESLGHASITTTENYLDSFSNEQKTHYANLLLSLKHK